MAGKAPSRAKQERGHTSRPYDRPNQSLLGRVASTVKGLFTPSSWFNIPIWTGNDEEEETSSSFTTTAVEPDLTENEDEIEDTVPERPRLPINRSKRQKIEDGNAPVSSTPIASPYWLEPSTSRDNLADKVDMSDSSILGGCQIGRKDTPVANGDDQSENSDGSASTSGCSSLISSQDKPHRSSGLKLSASALEHLRGELKNKPAFQRPKKDASIATDSLLNNPGNASLNDYSLWQYGSETVARPTQRQSLIARTKPSFNVSSFGLPSKEASTSKVSSPYYEGSTMYGGASSCRKRPLPSTSPYQFSSNKIMKSELGVKESHSGEELECMSAAAKRILHTLEKMSTPVSDAKKIPNVGASPLDIPLTLTPPSQRLKSYLSVSRHSPVHSPNPPPIVNLNSISKPSLLKNHKVRLARMAATQIPLRVQPILPVLLKESEETADVSSPTPSNRPSSPGSSGGKMKNSRKGLLHVPAKLKEFVDNVREYELPNIPLPVKTLPVISFDLKPRQSTKNSQEGKDSSNENELSFKFSNPIEYSAPAELLQPEKSVSSTFKFSSPLVVTSNSTPTLSSEKRSSETSSSRGVFIKTGSVEDALKQMREGSAKSNKQDIFCNPPSSAITRNNLDRSAKIKEFGKESTISDTSDFGDRFKPQEGSWSCSACLVSNQESSKVCVACETPKSAVTEKSFSTESVPTRATESIGKPSQPSDLFQKFQPEPGNWECSVCLVVNKEGEAKCVACETPNPKNSQKKTPDDIAISSKNNEKKDNTKKDPLFVISRFTKITSGTWECDACLVQNPLEKSKCVACETLRPSKEGDEGKSTAFPKSTSSQSTTGFTFGSLIASAATTSVTTTTFKFGIPPDFQKQPASSTTQNVFGIPASKAVSNPTNVSFKFGVPAEPTKCTETETSGEQKASETVTSSASNNSVTTSPVFKFSGSGGNSTNLDSSKGFVLGSNSQAESQKSSSENKVIQSVEGSKSTQKEDTDCVIISSTAIETPSSATVTAVTSSASEPIKSDIFMFGSGTTATATSNLSAPGGFKFQPPASMATSSFGASPFGNGIKVSDQQTPSSKVPSFASSEGFKPSSVVPVSTAPTTTESIVSPFHSKPSASEDTHKTVQAVSSSLPKPTQLNFCIPSSTTNTETNRTATVSTSSFGLFGSPSKQQPPFAFKTGDSSSMTKNVSAVFGAPQASQANPVAVGSSFTFGASSNIFCQAGGLKTEVKTSVPNQGFCISSPLQTAASSTSVSTSSVVQPFSFSNASASIAPVSSTSAFSVTKATAISSSGSATVSTAASSDASAPKVSNIFKFGDSSSSTDVKAFNAGFNFKRSNDDKLSGFAPTNKIPFGAAAPPFKCEPTSNSGMNALPSTPFQFGSPAAAQSTGGFVFGSNTKADPSQTSTPQFSFGSGPTKSSAFGGFQPSQPAVTASSMPTFSFGSSVNTATTTASMFSTPSGSSLFTFGAKNSQSSGSGSTNPTPLFGAASVQQPQQQQQPLFGSSTVSAPAFGSIPAPTFGAVAPAKPEGSSGFNFGASAPQQQQQQSLFVFGASSENKPAGTAQGTGFSFGMPATQGFSLDTPPSFNFGATSTPNQPFQFQGAGGESGTTPSTATPQSARRVRKAVRRNPKRD